MLTQSQGLKAPNSNLCPLFQVLAPVMGARPSSLELDVQVPTKHCAGRILFSSASKTHFQLSEDYICSYELPGGLRAFWSQRYKCALNCNQPCHRWMPGPHAICKLVTACNILAEAWIHMGFKSLYSNEFGCEVLDCLVRGKMLRKGAQLEGR